MTEGLQNAFRSVGKQAPLPRNQKSAGVLNAKPRKLSHATRKVRKSKQFVKTYITRKYGGITRTEVRRALQIVLDAMPDMEKPRFTPGALDAIAAYTGLQANVLVNGSINKMEIRGKKMLALRDVLYEVEDHKHERLKCPVFFG